MSAMTNDRPGDLARRPAAAGSAGRAAWDWQAGGAPPQRARRVLARLARTLAVMFIFGAFAWWRGHRTAAVVLAGLALTNALLAAFAPRAFDWQARLWERPGKASAFLISAIALTLAYFLLFTPGALLLRLLRKEPLKLRFPGPEATYWAEVDERGRSEADYRRQF